MDTSAFRNREQALENEFFHKVDRKLLDLLKSKIEQDDARESLASAAAIADQSLLDELVKIGIRAETLAAVALAPLVLTAWADGKVDAKEQAAVLKSAEEQGVTAGSPGYEILRTWMSNKPGEELFPAWQHYIRAMASSMSAAAMKQLRGKILSRARAIANVSGGVWEMGKVSTGEKRVLSSLESAFEPPDQE